MMSHTSLMETGMQIIMLEIRFKLFTGLGGQENQELTLSGA